MVLKRIKDLETAQRRDNIDIIFVRSDHQITQIPSYGAIAAYRDTDGIIKPATAKTPHEFWVKSFNSRGVYLFFSGILEKFGHSLIVDRHYVLGDDGTELILVSDSGIVYPIDEKTIQFRLTAKNSNSQSSINAKDVTIDSTLEIGNNVENALLFLNAKSASELKSETFFYLDPLAGNDENDGLSKGTAFASIEGAILHLKENYIINTLVILQLLNDYNFESNITIDFDEFRGNNTLVIDCNQKTLNLGSHILFLNNQQSLSGVIFLGSFKTRKSYIFGTSGRIIIYNSQGISFNRFELNQISITIEDSYKPEINDSTLKGARITFNTCDDPLFSNNELSDSSSLEASNCRNLIISDINLKGSDINSIGALSTFYFNILNSSIFLDDKFIFQGNFLSKNLFNFSGQKTIAKVKIRNLAKVSGNPTVVLPDSDSDRYFIEITDGAMVDWESDYRPLDDFIQNENQNRNLYIDGRSTLKTKNTSPLEFPVIDRQNKIDSEATIDGSNFRSTSGLVSTTQGAAIDELANTLGQKPAPPSIILFLDDTANSIDLLQKDLNKYDWSKSSEPGVVLVRSEAFTVGGTLDGSATTGLNSLFFISFNEEKISSLLTIKNFREVEINSLKFEENGRVVVRDCDSFATSNIVVTNYSSNKSFFMVYNTPRVRLDFFTGNSQSASTTLETFIFLENVVFADLDVSNFNTPVKVNEALVTCVNLKSLKLADSRDLEVEGRILNARNSNYIDIISSTSILSTIPDLYPVAFTLDGRDFDNTETGLNSSTKQDAIAELKTLIDRNYLSFTQLISGGKIEFKDSSSFVLYETVIYEFNESRDNPGWTEFALPTQTVSLSSALLSNNYLYPYLTGGIVGFDLNFPRNISLKERIYLGVITIVDEEIIAVIPQLIERNPYNESVNLLFAGGIKNESLKIVSIENTKSIRVTSGILQVIGRNFFNDPNDPHRVTKLEQNPLVYDLVAPDGTQIATDLTELDFSPYWDGSQVILTDDNDNTTIQHFYYCPNRPGNQWVAVINSRFYSDLNSCKQRWLSENTHITPTFLGAQTLLVAVLLGQKNAIDTSDIDRVAIVKIKSFLY